MVTRLLRLKQAPEPADAADGVAAALAYLMGVHLDARRARRRARAHARMIAQLAARWSPRNSTASRS